MATELKEIKRERNFSGIELEEGFEIMKNYRARLSKNMREQYEI